MKRWFIILVISWIAVHLVAFLLTPHFIPFGGHFPYIEFAKDYHLPQFLTSLANFDGAHYLLIAKSGYLFYQQAFFPLYPLMIHFMGTLMAKNYLAAAIAVSFVSFFLGLFFFKSYLKLILDKTKSQLESWRWAQLLLLAFPTSFFFTTVYTEGLFFLLVMLTLFTLKKERYYLAALFAFLTSLDRLVGAFLFIPIIFTLVENYIQIKGKRFNIRSFMTNQKNGLLVFIAPFIGLLSYCLYLWKSTGDPLFFLHAQSAFGAQRSSDLILFPQVIYRYIKIFITAQFNFQYFVSVLELSSFVFVLAVLTWEFIKLISNRSYAHFFSRMGLNLFSLANLLLPTFTGTFSSIPRYALMSLSFFIVLAEIKNTFIKVFLLLIFIILHLVLFGFFIQGYFIS